MSEFEQPHPKYEVDHSMDVQRPQPIAERTIGNNPRGKYGSYAHGTEHLDEAGRSIGFSGGIGASRDARNPDEPGDLGNANFGIGTWRDEEGNANRGIKLDANLYRAASKAHPRGGAQDLGYDIGVGTANAGVWDDGSTTNIGAQANAATVSVTSADDNQFLRAGLSAGTGAGLRIHHGEQAGLGFDLGPVSLDYKAKWLASLIS